MILILSMFFRVKAKVSTEHTMMTRVNKKPQQLDVSGSAYNIGLAPKTSQNLTNLTAQFANLSL